MRRWNGWGDTQYRMDLPPAAPAFLAERIGPAQALDDAGLDQVLAKVPKSRLPEHPLISTDKEDRVRHARGQSLPDWLAMRSGDFGCFPDGVAFPDTSQQVREVLDWCRQNDFYLIPYGGGTSVAGHINPLDLGKPTVTMDMGRMDRLIDLDETSLIATFGAGTAGPNLESQLRARGYTLGHFPQSFELSTLGGWVASRSSGQQSLRYGRIEQLFAGGHMETPRGGLELQPLPASSAGLDLREIVMGSEGRMGIITEVKVRVTPLPEQEDFYVIFFPSWQHARDAGRELVQQRIPLSMIRVSNATETQTQLVMAGHERQIRMLERYLAWRGCKTGKCMMTAGVTGPANQARSVKNLLARVVRKHRGVNTGTTMGKKWAAKRFMMPYLREALWEKGYAVDTLETATNWSNVDNLLNKIEHNLRTALGDDERVHVFTHLSHFYGQGCSIYTTYVFRCAVSYEGTYQGWQKLKSTSSEIIVKNGGTISHQHGVGKDHAPYLAMEKAELGMDAIGALVRAFDPHGLMNPGTLLRDEKDD